MAEDREDRGPGDTEEEQFEVLDEVGEVEGWDSDFFPDCDDEEQGVEDDDKQDSKVLNNDSVIADKENKEHSEKSSKEPSPNKEEKSSISSVGKGSKSPVTNAVTSEHPTNENVKLEDSSVNKDVKAKESTVSKDVKSKESSVSKDEPTANKVVKSEPSAGKDLKSKDSSVSKDVKSELSASKDVKSESARKDVKSESSTSKDKSDSSAAIDVKSNDSSASKDVKSKDSSTSKDVKPKESIASKDVKSESTSSKDVKSKDSSASKDVKSKDSSASKDVKLKDSSASKDVKLKDSSASKDVKSKDSSTSKDVKSKDSSTSKDVKSKDSSISKDVKSKDSSSSKDVKSKDSSSSKDVKSKDSSTSKDVKSKDPTANKDVKSKETSASKDSTSKEKTLESSSSKNVKSSTQSSGKDANHKDKDVSSSSDKRKVDKPMEDKKKESKGSDSPQKTVVSATKRKSDDVADQKSNDKKIKLSSGKTDNKIQASNVVHKASAEELRREFLINRKRFVTSMITLSEELKRARDYRRWAEKHSKDGMLFPVFDITQPSEPVLFTRCHLISGYEHDSTKLCFGFPRNLEVLRFNACEDRYTSTVRSLVKGFEEMVQSSGKPLFDPIAQQGYWHGVSVDTNINGKAILLVNVFIADGREEETLFSEAKNILLKHFNQKSHTNSQVSSIYLKLVSGKKDQATEKVGPERSSRCIMGCGFITETIKGLKIRLYPRSSFSTGSFAMAALCEELLKVVLQECCETVVELGCCTGVVGQVLSKHCTTVIGVDTAENIADAKVNAEENKLINCKYLDSNSKDVWQDLGEMLRGRPAALVIVNALNMDFLVKDQTIPWLQRTSKVKRVVYVRMLRTPKSRVTNLCTPTTTETRKHHDDPMPYFPLYTIPVNVGAKTFCTVFVLKHTENNFLNELYDPREHYSVKCVRIANSETSVPYMLLDDLKEKPKDLDKTKRNVSSKSNDQSTRSMTSTDKNRASLHTGSRDRSVSGGRGPTQRSADVGRARINRKEEVSVSRRGGPQVRGDHGRPREPELSSSAKNVWMNKDGLLTKRIDARHGGALPAQDLRNVLQSRPGHNQIDSLMNKMVSPNEIKDLRTVLQGKRTYTERQPEVGGDSREPRLRDEVINDRKRKLVDFSFERSSLIPPGTEDLRHVLQEKKGMGENIVAADRNVVNREFLDRSAGDGRRHLRGLENHDLRSFIEENRSTHNTEERGNFREPARLPYDVETRSGGHLGGSYRGEPSSEGGLYPSNVWGKLHSSNEPEAFPLAKDSLPFDRNPVNKINLQDDRRKVAFSNFPGSRGVEIDFRGSGQGRSFDDAELGKKRLKTSDFASGIKTDVRGLNIRTGGWKARDDVHEMENIHASFSKFDAYMNSVKSKSSKENQHGWKARPEFDRSFPNAGTKNEFRTLSPAIKHTVLSDVQRENLFRTDNKPNFFDGANKNTKAEWFAFGDKSNAERTRALFSTEESRVVFGEEGKRTHVEGSGTNKTVLESVNERRTFIEMERSRVNVDRPNEKNNVFGQPEDRKMSMYNIPDEINRNRPLYMDQDRNRPVYSEQDDRKRQMYDQPDDRRKQMHDKSDDRNRQTYDNSDDRNRQMYGKLDDRARQMYDKPNDRARQMYDKPDDRARQMYDKPDDRVRQMYDKPDDRARQMHDKPDDRARQMYDKPDERKMQMYDKPDDRKRQMYDKPDDRKRQMYDQQNDKKGQMYDDPADRKKQMYNEPEDRKRPVYDERADREIAVYDERRGKETTYGEPGDRRRPVYDEAESRKRSVHDEPKDLKRPMYEDTKDLRPIYDEPKDLKRQMYDEPKVVYGEQRGRETLVYGEPGDKRPMYDDPGSRKKPMYGDSADRQTVVYGERAGRDTTVYGEPGDRKRSMYDDPENRNKQLYKGPENKSKFVLDGTGNSFTMDRSDDGIGTKIGRIDDRNVPGSERGWPVVQENERNKPLVEEGRRTAAMISEREDKTLYSGHADVNRASYHGRGYEEDKRPFVDEPRSNLFSFEDVDQRISHVSSHFRDVDQNERDIAIQVLPKAEGDAKEATEGVTKRHHHRHRAARKKTHMSEAEQSAKKISDAPVSQSGKYSHSHGKLCQKHAKEAESKYQRSPYETRASDKKHGAESPQKKELQNLYVSDRSSEKGSRGHWTVDRSRDSNMDSGTNKEWNKVQSGAVHSSPSSWANSWSQGERQRDVQEGRLGSAEKSYNQNVIRSLQLVDTKQPPPPLLGQLVSKYTPTDSRQRKEVLQSVQQFHGGSSGQEMRGHMGSVGASISAAFGQAPGNYEPSYQQYGSSGSIPAPPSLVSNTQKYGTWQGGNSGSWSGSGGLNRSGGLSTLGDLSGSAGLSRSGGLSRSSGLSGSGGLSRSDGLSGSSLGGLGGLSGSAGLSRSGGLSGSAGLSRSGGLSGSAGLSRSGGLSGSVGLSGSGGLSRSGGLSGSDGLSGPGGMIRPGGVIGPGGWGAPGVWNASGDWNTQSSNSGYKWGGTVN